MSYADYTRNRPDQFLDGAEDIATMPEVRDLSAYHNDREYCSQTMLKALDESPARFKGLYIDGTVDDKDTDARRIGRCLHALVLQPDLFADLCPIMPRYELDPENRTKETVTKTGKVSGGKQTDSKSTNYYQDKKVEFEQANAGRDIIDEITLRRLKAMKSAILAHEEACFILENAEGFEIPHRWFDRIKRRCLIDILAPNLELIGDVKVMRRPPTPAAFAKATAEWRFWTQAPWYLRAAADKYGPGVIKRFVFICVHDKPPHEVAIHELDNRPPQEKPWMNLPEHFMSDVEWSDWRTEQLVSDLIQRRETDIWEASFQRGVNKVPLPRFVRSTFYDCEEETDGD